MSLPTLNFTMRLAGTCTSSKVRGFCARRAGAFAALEHTELAKLKSVAVRKFFDDGIPGTHWMISFATTFVTLLCSAMRLTSSLLVTVFKAFLQTGEGPEVVPVTRHTCARMIAELGSS